MSRSQQREKEREHCFKQRKHLFEDLEVRKTMELRGKNSIRLEPRFHDDGKYSWKDM